MKIAGFVKFWNRDRGFGFLGRDDGGEDTFVHVSAVEESFITPPSLDVGARVKFDIRTSPKTRKPEAFSFHLVDA